MYVNFFVPKVKKSVKRPRVENKVISFLKLNFAY